MIEHMIHPNVKTLPYHLTLLDTKTNDRWPLLPGTTICTQIPRSRMIQRPSGSMFVLRKRRTIYSIHGLAIHVPLRPDLREPGEFFDAGVCEGRDILPRNPDRVQPKRAVRADPEGAGTWEERMSNTSGVDFNTALHLYF